MTVDIQGLNDSLLRNLQKIDDAIVDFNKVKILQSSPTPPQNPITGEWWYDEKERKLKRFDGTNWIELSRASYDIDNAVKSVNLNGINFKNKIINGDFSVWQRGTAGTGSTNATYTADRWIVLSNVGDLTFDWIRVAGDGDLLNKGFHYGIKIQKTSGTGHIEITQFIENITQFASNKPVTISFYAKSTTTTSHFNILVALQATIGRFVETTAEVVSEQMAVDNTFRRYEVTLNVPDWATLNIDWSQLENTALAVKIRIPDPNVVDDLVISGVQLEKGTVATDFEYVPFDIQLQRCMRYFEIKKETYAIAASDAATLSYSKKRVNPSIVRIGDWNSPTESGTTFVIIDDSSAVMYNPSNTSVGGIFKIDAEL